MTRSPMRVWLALGTALGSMSGLAATAAHAQAVRLPRPADGTTVARSPLGLDARITRDGSTLNVQLRAATTVIEWNGFNVPQNATADFRTVLPFNAAVLNRDVSGTRSQILGRVTSGDNVAVWIMNPNGILAGSRSVFSTGSLVLTTLDVNQADFLANGRNFRLTAPDMRTAGIDIVNGARIQTAGGPRGLVMVAPRIDAAGSFDAGDADVAFVTASDVTLAYGTGSPLSVTLNRGTAVPGRSQYVRGTVAGADAIFALASQATVTDALLQVDARVTTALAGTRGIVLSAGRPATALSGVSTSSVVGAADGVVSLSFGGAMTTTDGDGGSDILAGASGSAAFTGALDTRRDVVLAGGGALSVTDAVAAGRDYRLSGAGITLGEVPVPPSTTPVAVVQDAGGLIDIRSTGGDIVGRAGLTLRSGTGGIAMTTGGTGGNVAFARRTLIAAGDDRGGALRIQMGDAANTLALGDVRAQVLRAAAGAAPTGDRVVLGTAVSLGDVDTRRSLDITAAGLAAGDLASDRGVALNLAGALEARTVRARAGTVSLTGAGDTIVTGIVGAAGAGADVRVVRAGTLTLADLAATRDVVVDAGGGSAAVAGNVTAGRDYVASGATVLLGGDADVRQAATRDVRIRGGAGGITGQAGLTLVADTDGSGRDLLSLGIDPAAGAIGGGIVFAGRSQISGGPLGTSEVQVRSADAGGIVTLGTVTASRLTGAVGDAVATIGIERSGAIGVGSMTVREDLVLRGASVTTGALTSTNGLVRVGGTAGGVTTGDIAARGAAVIAAPGDVSLGRVDAGGQVRVTADGALTMRGDAEAGADLGLAGASLTLNGNRYASGGGIDMRAAVGGIASTGAVALVSTGTNPADSVRLQATGVQGIVLARGSRIVAGADRALRVGVFNGAPDAPLALGDVSARSLGALAMFDGDASRPAGAIVSAGSLRFERLDLVDGFAAQSTGGDLSVEAISVTGTRQGISLKAAGTLDVQRDVTASGDVVLASGTDLTFGVVESRDGRASVSSGGVATLGTLAGALGATLDGLAIVAGEVRGGSVRATASAGDALLGDVDGTTVQVSATGLAGVGGLIATGTADVTGGTIALSGTHAAVGRYTATATAGSLRGGEGLTIGATPGARGLAAVDLSATGGVVSLDPGTRVSGGAVSVRTDGARIALGTIRADTLTIAGATNAQATIRTGDIVLTGDLALSAASGVATGDIAARTVRIDGGDGSTTTGTLRAGAVTLSGARVDLGTANVASLSATALRGAVTGGNVTASGAVTADASGAVTFGRVIAGGNMAMTAGGTITLAGLDSGGSAILRAGSDVMARDGIAAVDTVEVIAGGSIRAPFIRSTAGDLTVAAPSGNVTGFVPGTPIALSAGPGGMFSLTAGRRVTLGDLGGGSVFVEAPVLSVGAVAAGTGAVTLRANDGSLTVVGPITGGAVTLAATEGLLLTDVTARGALSLAGGTGDIGFGTLSGRSVQATTRGAFWGNGIVSAGTVTVAGGTVALRVVEAGSNATLTAGSGDLSLGTLTAGGDAVLTAAGDLRTTGGAIVERAYRIEGRSVTLGAATQRAGGAIAITARGGGIAAAPGLVLAGSQVTLDTSGGIALDGSRIETPGTLALRAGQGTTIALGEISAGSIAGFDGRAAVGELVHAGSFSADDVTAGTLALRLTRGDLTLGQVTSRGAVSLATTTGTIATGALDAGTLAIDGGGAVSTGAIGVRGAASVAGATLTLGDVRAGTLAIRSEGTLDGTNGAAPALTTTGGDLSVQAGTIRLAAVDSAGSATLRGQTITVAGRLSAARQALADARAALTLGDVTAGDTLTLTAGGTLSAGATNAGGALSAGGDGVTIASIDTGAALDVESRGAIRLGRTVAAGAVTLAATGTATLDALTGGPSISVIADDAALGGAVRATNVTFATRDPSTTVLRIGDGTAAGGFGLSASEINQVTSDRLRIDAGAGDMEIGTTGFGAATGGVVEMLSTGTVRVTGAVSAAGAGRSFRIGGDAGDAAMAGSIHVAATSDAGGRLLLAGHDVDLRGGRIAVGLVPGFIDTLPAGEAGLAQAAALIGNGNSALYNSQFGGGFFAPAANTTVAARSLTVRFGNFALFQNTGVPGSFAGVVLGTVPATPGLTALRVSSSSQGQTSFALFGTINGINGPGTALLGNEVIDIEPRLLATSRINGCLAGSGAGCLTTIVIQPTLQVFDWDSEDVFGISQDVAVPFTPIVGGNNEGLLTSLPELAPGNVEPTRIAPPISPPRVFRTIVPAPAQEVPRP